MFRRLLTLLSPALSTRLQALQARLRGEDLSVDLVWIGHKDMLSLPHRPTAAARGALERWEWSHPLTRWDLMGIYHDPQSSLEKWFGDVS